MAAFPAVLHTGWRGGLAARMQAFELSAPAMRLLLLVAVLAAVVGAVYAWRSRPVAEPVSPPPLSAPLITPAPNTTAAPATPTAPGVTVHVTGKVRRPGVLSLPGGSRVTDAVAAAGGLKGNARTGSLNLARRLVDGEQIVVGGPGGAPPPPPYEGAPSPAIVLDLNSATAEQLDALPGVGEVLARRIIDYRTTHQGFRAVEQLKDVSGIGDSKYADIKDKVRV